MRALLVTYDLKQPGQNYNDLLDAIKSYPWARLSESSYAISTSLTPSQVYNHLSAYLDRTDTIYVITLTRPYSGWGPKDVNEWLEKHL